jgi:cytochrome c553
LPGLFHDTAGSFLREASAVIRFPVFVVVALCVAVPAARAQGTAPPKSETCATCHGPNGNSTQPQYPILAGQTSRYLYLQLRDFQEGRRSDPQMTPMAAGLSRDEMRALADWFAAQKPAPQGFQADPAKARLGKAKADETLCTMCHLGGFAGQNEIPRVAGQHYDYIVKQLSDFKARRRTNDAGNMTSVASTLSEEDIRNLAQYIAGL